MVIAKCRTWVWVCELSRTWYSRNTRTRAAVVTNAGKRKRERNEWEETAGSRVVGLWEISSAAYFYFFFFFLCFLSPDPVHPWSQQNSGRQLDGWEDGEMEVTKGGDNKPGPFHCDKKQLQHLTFHTKNGICHFVWLLVIQKQRITGLFIHLFLTLESHLVISNLR